MAFPLLSTKFYVPPAGPALVARPRLVESFDLGLSRPLTLVSAPPGFGKTTLVASWIAARRAAPLAGQNLPFASPGAPAETPAPRFCWLSLDPADSDPSRFWVYLVAALSRGTALPGRLGEILDLLQSNPLPTLEPFLDTLINALDGLGVPVVLVLDDYHLVKAAPIHQGMSYLVEHLPPQVHLVILTRVDPPLPIHRLRARGQLHELRAADLRFTSQEAADLFQRLTGRGLPPEDAAALAESTEGWAAGLQMAALALQAQLAEGAARPAAAGGDPLHEFIAGFSGKHHYILDYLAEEVFNRQPARIQAFLLQTSILERMCAPLCAAVTGWDASATPLARDADATPLARDADATPLARDADATPLARDADATPLARDASATPLARDADASPAGSAPNGQEVPGGPPLAALDARSILNYLERANLFLVPLDGERQWYRYHHLFADLLRARLRQAMPSRAARQGLHARASAWFEANDWSGEAISHALAGEDWEGAARLMEHNIQDFIARGQLSQVMGWIEALPPQVAHNRPRLSIELAWALTFASQVQKAAPYLQDATAALDVMPLAPWPKPPGLTRDADATPPAWDASAAQPGDRPDPAEASLLRGLIAVMQAYGAIMAGDRAGALTLAQAALGTLPAGPSRQRAFLNWVAGFASRSLGEMEQAYGYLSEAARISRQSCNFLEVMVLLSEFGITCWLMGKLAQAVELFRETLRVGAESGVPNHGYLSRVESYYSVVLLEQNDLEGALRHARTSVEYASWWPSANHTTTAFTYLGRALQAAGDLEGAAEAFRRAEEEAHQGPVLEGVQAELEIRRVRLWLDQGDLADAVRWADAFRRSPEAQLDPHQPPTDPQAARLVTLGQVRLAQHLQAPQGDEAALAEAVELLEGLAQAARAAGRTHALIEILVLLAAGRFCQAQLLASRSANAAAMERALMALDAALQLGQPEGYVQVFLEGCQPVEALLHQHRLRQRPAAAVLRPEGGVSPAYIEKLLAAFSPAAQGICGGNQAGSPVVAAQSLAEPLTERELDVLRLLALGLSNHEIAEKLVVSEGTVKTHVHNLIGKLDARGRSHAVALARELGLL